LLLQLCVGAKPNVFLAQEVTRLQRELPAREDDDDTFESFSQANKINLENTSARTGPSSSITTIVIFID
jgi:hypothetical protein